MSPLIHEERKRLSDILSEQAALAPFSLGSLGYFRSLIQKTNLPPKQKAARIGGLTGDPGFDARSLIDWADQQGGNPADPRYTTLGALLKELLPDLGIEAGRWVAALIVARGLYRDPALISALQREWHIPLKAPLIQPGTAGAAPGGALAAWDLAASDLGPEVDWAGPQDALELQSFLQPEPDFQDVGFLMRAIQRAAGVCRIIFENSSRVGTGFLIGKKLVLTNFHVMVENPNLDIDYSNELQSNGLQARLQFGVVSTPSGEETSGQQFSLDSAQPVLKWSPVTALDYALLQVEESVTYQENLSPLPLSSQMPLKGNALNILQYPGGAVMQLALSGDGVVSVMPERGLVQYATRALGGSSGAPCFDNDWQVIALHHAQRARSFGVVREGIIMKNILNEIEPFLN